VNDSAYVTQLVARTRASTGTQFRSTAVTGTARESKRASVPPLSSGDPAVDWLSSPESDQYQGKWVAIDTSSDPVKVVASGDSPGGLPQGEGIVVAFVLLPGMTVA
jgi:hypothetical protein